MRRVIIQSQQHIHPFNEPARDLRVQNKPLWLWQRDLLAAYTQEEREYPSWDLALRSEADDAVESLVHRDNLFFNEPFVAEFLAQARAMGAPVRLALHADDPAIAHHVRPLSTSFVEDGALLLADMWYLPSGASQRDSATPLVIDTESRERGYYHVPPYMATEFGDLTYQLPRRAFIIIESWVHLFVADILFGVFTRGVNQEDRINSDWRYKLRILLRSLVEQRQVLESSELVHIGHNVTIDPSARIHGPTVIGNNVTIGAGAVIDNCTIGNNVTVSQGCQLMLSVIGDGCFLPFRASLFMTTLMENTMVAQNTCLQLCVVGRDTFIGAGTTFTDFNILPSPLKAMFNGRLRETNFLVLGGCIGHHCRLSSGLIIHPARTVESDVVLLARNDRNIISQNISFEDSDHFQYAAKYPFPRLYPRRAQETVARST
jgi:UDP-N-acetylglucosamine diphosphorylase / glucose-1-phosphate thymidylyltransferase / UDP-N-acetylgalactosamine diphosphorylase / glucosamine-1-phosphate N-acetyltransferase / galactosamine-1-phosphate N-acetyltransferase